MGAGGYNAGPIWERIEELNDNIVNFSDVKKGDLYVNLIQYDKNMKNEKNMEYYRYFSIKIIGDYYPFDDFDMLKLFLSKLKQIPFAPCYILMISGNEIETIIKEINDNDFILDILIFNYNKGNYDYLKNKNKIKLITNNFYEIREYLKSKNFSKEDLSMDNHLLITPLITYYDYKKCLFPIHRILAYFFKKKIYGFSYYYYQIAKEFIMKATLETEVKEKIIEIMKKLINCDEFGKECIKYYTGENLCYVFNKALRNFEKYYVEMAHFIGPFYYGIFKYSLDNPRKQLKEKKILYRDITMDRLDLYSYQFCENDIICFPSFTSTTLDEKLNFKPSDNAVKINNEQIEEKSYVKMIINYKPEGKCIHQGLDISDESQVSDEKEILLFPFTFLKIDKVEIHSGKENDKHYIYMTIINKGDLLENILNENFAFKLIENGTKIIKDDKHNSAYNDNEEFYKMNFKCMKEKSACCECLII